MGYQTIRDGIATMLIAKNFTESQDVFDFASESDQSISKKFRIQRPEVSLEGPGTEYIATLVRPISTYTIALGFKLTPARARFDYDVSQNLIDTIIAYLNNPTNYSSYCISIKTKKLETALVDDHLETTIQLEVLDDINLS